MADLRELYQDTILDHSKKPRNFREIPGATAKAVGHNPLCGDRVTVYLRLDAGNIADIAFIGQGCAISKASASLMTDAVKGKSKSEATRLFERFRKMVTGRPGDPIDASLGKLAVLSGVCEFPVRVKCASLPWHTLEAALEAKQETVSLE
ncbi:MAG: SUF system NifU family Fe-S cluster assembly protein [Methanobacteriota archaeon]|nr:MAG: SUF system NifU family Fe-S cluster assembly protein [Euryarchaeota archaeon]TLZ82602.1 MAG: SUF system NifU family Fe-S cluster assembly protein [Euryarchaeota archaeon]